MKLDGFSTPRPTWTQNTASVFCQRGRDFRHAVVQGDWLYVMWLDSSREMIPLGELTQMFPSQWPFDENGDPT